MEKQNSSLTEKQKRFVEEYLLDLHPTNAVIRAGYPEKQASHWARKLLAHTGVCMAVAEAKECRRERVGVTQDQVVRELAAIAFAAMSDSISNLKLP